MYERFTDRARKVMQLANQEAQRSNHEYIGTEHILLGLVKEGTGVAAHVFKNLDIDLRTIRREVEKIIQVGPNRVTIGKLPQTPRAKKVIEHSIEEARNLNHNYVGTEHLLLGLLREQEGMAAQVLMNLGLTLENVREEVLNLLGVSSGVREDDHQQADVPLVADMRPALSHFPEDVVKTLQVIDSLVEKLIQEKEEAIAEQDFETAARLLAKADKVKQQIRDAVQKLQTVLLAADDSSKLD